MKFPFPFPIIYPWITKVTLRQVNQCLGVAGFSGNCAATRRAVPLPPSVSDLFIQHLCRDQQPSNHVESCSNLILTEISPHWPSNESFHVVHLRGSHCNHLCNISLKWSSTSKLFRGNMTTRCKIISSLPHGSLSFFWPLELHHRWLTTSVPQLGIFLWLQSFVLS